MHALFSWVRDLNSEGIEPHPGPRYITKNVNGISDLKVWEKILFNIKYEHKKSPIGAVFLQEIRIGDARKHKDMAEEHGLYMLAHGNLSNRRAGGTAILIPQDSIEQGKNESHHQAWTRVRKSLRCLPQGRGIACDTLLKGNTIRLASVYAPADPDARPAFFNTLNKRGHRFINKKTIMGIDANCVPDVLLDRKSQAASQYNNTGADTLNQVVASLGLIDVARAFLGNKPFFTSFHNTSAGLTSTRIDRVYAPDMDGLMWEHSPVLTEIFPRPPGALILDHEPAQITLHQVQNVRGNDIPRINESIFDDAAFVSKVAEEIERQTQAHAGDWSVTWTSIKERVRAMSIAQTRKLKKSQSKAEREMKQRIRSLKSDIDGGEAQKADMRLYIELQAELSTIQKESYFEQHPEDLALYKGKRHDTGSALFFRPWKPRDSYHWIASIFNATWQDPSSPQKDGTSATEPSRIPAAITEYYKALYAHKPIDQQAKDICLDTLRSGNRVLPPTAERCGAPITAPELEDTMNLLPTGKSPGPDCIPNKFYRTFSKTLAPILEHVFEESMLKGRLPNEVGDGLISLLYKKGERDDPRNYRPITLLNSDYKIMMRVLASRMNEAVTQFVSDPQTGFVPDSFLPENIMLLKLIQAWAEDENEELYFLFLDMEKAFDRCSWEFMIEALEAVGMNQRFINFVKLAYSDTTSRKIAANGHLGPAFNLHSGVAQGCPLSPLLFLLITEPLTRLIHPDRRNIRPNPILSSVNRIRGALIGAVRHRISQFADDSTLILRPGDESEAEVCLDIWQRATSMKENKSKREGLLLGRLNINRQNAPHGVVADDKWQPDGKTIRALGVPMGNKVDYTEWYLARYRTVKERYGMWPVMRRLSLKGRNLILQSMYYGSFRFWLYSIEMPEVLKRYLHLDAQHILWATAPKLITHEYGSARARPYIARKAAHRPEQKGGAGIMHWDSHCRAVYAEWIKRMLHPRRAPWKEIVRAWYPEWNRLEEGIFLSTPTDRKKILKHIPYNAKYLRKCITEFHKLDLTQNTDIEDATLLAEPLLLNNRFDVSLPEARYPLWIDGLSVVHVRDLFDPATDAFYTAQDWHRFFRDELPGRNRRLLEGDLDSIHAQLPGNLEHTCAIPAPSQLQSNSVVALVVEGHAARYARINTEGPQPTYELLFLDKHRRPHDTGISVVPSAQEEILPTEAWDDTPTIPKPEYGSPAIQEIWDRMHQKPHSIIGPITVAYPRNIGWYPSFMDPTANDKPLKISDLTVHNLTNFLTTQKFGSKFPNCVKAWKKRIHHVMRFSIIFRSFGTDLSDATEEKQWRKMVQRAINVRNRHPNLDDHTCRHCRLETEDMLHLVKCRGLQNFWRACVNFTIKILLAPRPKSDVHAIIFGQWDRSDSPEPLGPEDARAFLRHAFNVFFHDFCNITHKKIPLMWESTYLRAVLSFQSAVLRRGKTFSVLYANRCHTSLPCEIPEEERNKYNHILIIKPGGQFHLSPTFVAEVERAKAQLQAVKTHQYRIRR